MRKVNQLSFLLGVSNMNDMFKVLESEIDVLDASLYDFEETDLSKVLFDKSKNILMKKAIGLIEKTPAFKEFLESLKVQQIFDVSMSKSAKELYEKGELVLKCSKKKNGLIPILFDRSGKFSEQVTLNTRDITPELSSALSNLAIQQQLGQLMDQMKLMNNTIQRIEIGQRDDRIGLYLSARQQFIEAMNIKDTSLQSQALLNSALIANNAKHQLMQSMRSDIKQIINNNSLGKKERDKLSDAVRSSMKYINETTSLCTMAYSALGEDKALLASLKNYQCFIEQTLLRKHTDGLLISEKLHQNWNGADNEWLKLPKKIVRNLEEQILVRAKSPVLIENEV